MKIKQLIKSVFKIPLVIAWIIIVVIGYAEFKYFRTYISKPLRNGYLYLGDIGNRKIYASYQ